MSCDGLTTLACIRGYDRDLTKPSVITPMGHMFVLKDLVVDMTNFYTQYKFIEPYLKRKTPKVYNIDIFINYKIIQNKFSPQIKESTINLFKIEKSWMVFMNALCVQVVAQVAQVIGGIQIDI